MLGLEHDENTLPLIRLFASNWLATLACFCLLSASFSAFALELSAAEREVVSRQGPITFCVDPDWKPFEHVDDKGQHAGIAADLLALVAQRTGLTLQLLRTQDWPESLKASKDGRCQLMSLLNQTPARSVWLDFTQPLLTDDNVLITREEHPFIGDLAGLQNHTMVLPKGTSVEERVRRDYPNIRIVITDTEAQALAMVSDRRADMTMRSLIVAAYTIKREGWFNLKIAGQVPDYGNRLRIGVLKGLPELRQVLDKGVASITPVERQQIIDRHITIQATTRVDYGLVWQVGAVMALLVLTSLFWLRKLKQVNTALLASETSLLQVQRIAGLGSYEMDIPTATRVNSVIFDEVFGMPPAQTSQRQGWQRLIHPDDHARVLEHYRAVVAGQLPVFDLVYRIVRYSDGAERWIHNLGQVNFGSQGQALTFTGTIQDITERKQAELQLQQATALAEQTAEQQRHFIAMLSHQVRTPLTVLDTAAQVLRLRLADHPELWALADRLHRGAMRLSNFFDNCLTSDRIGTEDFTVQSRSVSAQELGRWVREGAELLSGEHRFALNVAPDVPDLHGDPALLRIMLINLLSNALKYSPPETTVTLLIGHRGPMCHMEMQDQGPGIAADEMEAIFQKYRRGRATQGTDGAGLGLTLVQRIAQLHRGHVHAYNRAEGGAAFVVEIPFGTAECKNLQETDRS